jgi:predicted nucleotide-binding protein
LERQHPGACFRFGQDGGRQSGNWHAGGVRGGSRGATLEDGHIHTTPVSDSAEHSRVFVVHGHDEALRLKIARFIERRGIEPIILDEQVDRGRTIIEKFEEQALAVGFAVALLTPDDFATETRGDWPDQPNRARQNVLLELGYFMGSLGREKTAALYAHGTQLPSDLHGLFFIPLDSGWELRLAKEMRDAGLPIDLNKL